MTSPSQRTQSQLARSHRPVTLSYQLPAHKLHSLFLGELHSLRMGLSPTSCCLTVSSALQLCVLGGSQQGGSQHCLPRSTFVRLMAWVDCEHVQSVSCRRRLGTMFWHCFQVFPQLHHRNLSNNSSTKVSGGWGRSAESSSQVGGIRSHVLCKLVGNLCAKDGLDFLCCFLDHDLIQYIKLMNFPFILQSNVFFVGEDDICITDISLILIFPLAAISPMKDLLGRQYSKESRDLWKVRMPSAQEGVLPWQIAILYDTIICASTVGFATYVAKSLECKLKKMKLRRSFRVCSFRLGYGSEQQDPAISPPSPQKRKSNLVLPQSRSWNFSTPRQDYLVEQISEQSAQLKFWICTSKYFRRSIRAECEQIVSSKGGILTRNVSNLCWILPSKFKISSIVFRYAELRAQSKFFLKPQQTSSQVRDSSKASMANFWIQSTSSLILCTSLWI